MTNRARGEQGVNLVRCPPLVSSGFCGSRVVMAGSEEARVDQAPNVASAVKGNMSVRPPDVTEKGKMSEGSTSTPTTAGDKVAEMLGRLNLTSQESTAFI